MQDFEAWDARPIRDAEAWEEFRELMGTEKAHEARDELARRLRPMLSDVQDLSGDGEELAALRQQAHDLVARSGILGFPELSGASADLDSAIAKQADLGGPLQNWTSSIERALDAVAREKAGKEQS